MRCDEARELAPELALGIAAGEERAEGLRHVADCAACRLAVRELSDVADELLLLAPSHEPAPGFESRVLARVGAPGGPGRRVRRLAMRLAAPVAAALAGAAIVFAALDDERELAGSYRETLDVADGQYFRAARLEGPGGTPAGFVFGYQGRTSWVLVVVDHRYRDGAYSGELVTDTGRRTPLRGFALDPRSGSWGRAIPTDLHDVSSVRLVDRRTGETLEAVLRRR